MINKAILMGRLTRDPELRHTGTGTPEQAHLFAVLLLRLIMATVKIDRQISSIALPGIRRQSLLINISAKESLLL